MRPDIRASSTSESNFLKLWKHNHARKTRDRNITDPSQESLDAERQCKSVALRTRAVKHQYHRSQKTHDPSLPRHSPLCRQAYQSSKPPVVTLAFVFARSRRLLTPALAGSLRPHRAFAFPAFRALSQLARGRRCNKNITCLREARAASVCSPSMISKLVNQQYLKRIGLVSPLPWQCRSRASADRQAPIRKDLGTRLNLWAMM